MTTTWTESTKASALVDARKYDAVAKRCERKGKLALADSYRGLAEALRTGATEHKAIG